jgi:hypothetical protein
MFEYNEIDVSAVQSVELLADDDSEYMSFKRRLYDDDDKIPEERRRMAESEATELYTDILTLLITADLDVVILDIIDLKAEIPDYIGNATELRDGLLRTGTNTDVEVKISDRTPKKRAECRFSKDDDYRSGDEHMCCWKCSDDDTSRPNKFEATDDPGEDCERYTPRGFEIKKELSDHLVFDESNTYGFLAKHFQDSNLKVHDVQSRFKRAKDSRSAKVQLAFRAAFPDEEYYYQRAEALLRDIDADVAEESGPGSGGRRFEYEAIEQLSKRFELRDETVFKIKFKDDAPPAAYSDFVDDPSEHTYKEADAIIGGEIGPIVVDFFTQRSPRAKRRQVQNYAELYEKATGTEPLAWGVTDNAHGELLELDTLTTDNNDPTPEAGGQIALTDFIE